MTTTTTHYMVEYEKCQGTEYEIENCRSEPLVD